ncbi:MAG: glycosyltransferase family 39 protein [Myxococcales bacterium]|nr:glycosyltransferase family 39 protein [Myxococcales bacterium]
MTSPTQPSLPNDRRARVAAGLLALLFVAQTLPLSLSMGTHLEEVAPVVPVPLSRMVPNAGELPLTAPAQLGLRASTELPVWTWSLPGGFHLPLMIDGHMGALTSLPWRAAIAVGDGIGSAMGGSVGIGILFGRLLSIALGLLTLAMVFKLTEPIAGRRAAWAAALIAASSPHFALIFHWSRPDEQLAGLAPLLAVLAAMRVAHGQRHATRWWLLCGLLFGVGAASKLTSGWLLIAALVAATAFRQLPPVRLWLPIGLAFTLPMTAHVAWFLLAPSRGPLAARVNKLPSPVQAFSDERIAFFARHFVDAFGAAGDFWAAQVIGAVPSAPAWPVAGVSLGLACAVVVTMPWVRRAGRPVRMLGLGALVVGLLYLGLYYRGMSLFLLLAPWVPVVAGVAGWLVWRAARTRGQRTRSITSVVLGGLLAVTVGGQLQQAQRLRAAVFAAQQPMFDLSLQRRVASALVGRGITTFWTTTYAEAGVFETLSGGVLRTHNLSAALREFGKDGREPLRRHTAAWSAILNRWPPGTHYLLLAMNPPRIAISPLEDGPAIAAAVPIALAVRGGKLTEITRWTTRDKTEAWRLLKITLPK